MPALMDIVRYYTREAGVRNLEREIAKICRKAVKQLLLQARRTRSRSPSRRATSTSTWACAASATARRRSRTTSARSPGLAWTEVGGELLTIEAAVVPGKGKLQHTGQLGEVMQESIQAAMTVVRSRAQVLGLEPDFYQKHDVHMHMPEGATPKDGPSAGIGMCTALVSALTKIPVRSDVAMTGEITLRGEVLPIGGLKEKLLAAHRGGIKTVLIPDENQKDLVEIPDNIKGNLEIKPVKWIDEVLEVALTSSRCPPRLRSLRRRHRRRMPLAASSRVADRGSSSRRTDREFCWALVCAWPVSRHGQDLREPHFKKSLRRRDLEVRALIDTGSSYMIVTRAVAAALGFDPSEFSVRNVTLADGRRILVPVIGPLQIDFDDRECKLEAAALDGGECLMGFIPLEAMDLIVDRLKQRLVGAHEGGPVFRA